MTSGRPASGDGFHILIMDLHKEINRLQSEISTEVVQGAKAYGITEADRSLITAFMTGVWRMPAVTPASSFSLLAVCAQHCAGAQSRARTR